MSDTCPVCRNGISEGYGGLQWNIGGSRYRLSRCGSCGSAFTDPLPDDAALEQLYRTFNYQWYRDHYDAKLKDSRTRVDEYRQFLRRRVLDFGGGLGYFSAAAREQGLESMTFDPFYQKESEVDRGWDTIVALHVIEHANDPDALIGRIKGLLGPGGNLIAAVPNFLSRGYRELGMSWVWAQPPLLHVFHFTAAGLQSLLARHGFRDFKISYHERWDANLTADLEEVRRFRKLDAAWSRWPLSLFPAYRRRIAARNAAERFKALEQALTGYDPGNDGYAELQIVATAP